MGTVFISYARVDKPTALELRTLLKSYLPEDTAFVDTEDLAPGARWEEALYAAIDASHTFLALVSLEWDQSENCQKEWKAATARKGLRVVPLAVGEGVEPKRLEAFKVFNSPTTERIPRGLGQEELRRVLVPIVGRIVDVVRPAKPPVPPPPAPRPPTGPRRADDPLQRAHGPELLIHVTRTAVGWYIRLERDGVTRGEWALTEDELPAPSPHLTDLGDALGRALLARADKTWLDDPLHGPLQSQRCRIIGSAPELLRLPWRLTRLRGHWLVEVGWTFELSPPGAWADDRVLPLNARALLVLPRAPQVAPAPDDAPLRTVLHAGGRHEQQITVARDVAEVRGAVHPAPALVLLAADPSDGSVLLDDAEDTAELPAYVCDRICHPEATELLILLGRTAPLLPPTGWLGRASTAIWSTTPAHGAELDDLAGRLLRAIVEDGRDPVWAVEHAAGLQTPAAATLNVYTRWRTWRAEAASSRPSHAGAVLREIDREHARDAARTQVDLLVKNSLGGRCLVLAGFADTQADLLPEALPGQLREDLGVKVKEIGISKRGLNLPPADPARVVPELIKELTPAAGETLSAFLQRLVERQSHRPHPVLWLEARKPLVDPTADTLARWIAALDQVVGPHVPAEMHVVLCFVAVSRDPQALSEALSDALDHVPLRHSAVKLLDPLGDVKREEIAQFLGRTDVSHCPRDRARAVASLIYQRTRGNFRKTVEALEAAEADHYHTILRDLEPPR
jgi:hypothetical protein